MSSQKFAGAEELALHILKALTRHQMNDRPVTLQDLVDEIKARRGDLRKTISSLDREGYVDALRMRLTMKGFAIGASLQDVDLPPLRLKALHLVAA